MEGLNDSLFLMINAPLHPAAWTVTLAVLLANWAVPAIVLGFVALWIRAPARHRPALVTATLAMLAGEGCNQLAGMLVLEPRPFMAGLGHTLIAHVPDNSFPSDHATFVWCLGFSLIAVARGRLRVAGWGLAGIGLGVAWARVYLGVHFPADMAGSAAVSLAMAGLAPVASPVVARWLVPRCSLVYEAGLRTLHLPQGAFPRQLPPGGQEG